ncbi:hypothetical protein CO653_34155 [Rhizobium anhuiense]|nr:hypothetical protein CO653_34155 [Rhizobium anhuiense]
MTSIEIQPWDGSEALETEATAADGRWLSLYTAPLPACPWGRWVWTVDTQAGAGDHELRPVAMGIEHSPETARAAAEAAARHWLQPRPRLEAVA